MSFNHHKYTRREWFNFANKIKTRDQFHCVTCHRDSNIAVLQVHHLHYIKNKLPWEYELSDCVTLCKRCHAAEHQKVDPIDGWSLLHVFDLNQASGCCERTGCGKEIRYEHLIYHPQAGYKTVGSTCVDVLTLSDQLDSKKVLALFEKLSKFNRSANWRNEITKMGRDYHIASYRGHQIRIYGCPNDYAIQLWIKRKEEKWHDPKKIHKQPLLNLRLVQQLGFIYLLHELSTDVMEQTKLKSIYENIVVFGKETSRTVY